MTSPFATSAAFPPTAQPSGNPFQQSNPFRGSDAPFGRPAGQQKKKNASGGSAFPPFASASPSFPAFASPAPAPFAQGIASPAPAAPFAQGSFWSTATTSKPGASPPPRAAPAQRPAGDAPFSFNTITTANPGASPFPAPVAPAAPPAAPSAPPFVHSFAPLASAAPPATPPAAPPAAMAPGARTVHFAAPPAPGIHFAAPVTFAAPASSPAPPPASPAALLLGDVPADARAAVAALPRTPASCALVEQMACEKLAAGDARELGGAFALFRVANELHALVFGAPSANALYNLACCLSLSVAAAAPATGGAPPGAGAAYGGLSEDARLDAAATWLKAAVAAGFHNHAHIAADADLAPLRARRARAVEVARRMAVALALADAEAAVEDAKAASNAAEARYNGAPETTGLTVAGTPTTAHSAVGILGVF